MYLVGIDVGGTKSDFLLCDENENQLKRVILGAGNPNDIGIDACISLLSQGLDELCENIAPDAVFAGVSGGGYGENAIKIKEFLKNRYPEAKVDNGTDALNLINCSRFENAGALICGTGSALFLRTEGRLLRFGGWGHFFDDGGSGYDIGREALRFLLDCEEKSAQMLDFPLCRLLLDRLGSSAHDALSDFYKKGKTYVASFSPLVFEACEQGDVTARQIIERNVATVAERIESALNTACGMSGIEEIICAGGLFNSPIFYELLIGKTQAPLSLLTVPPVMGACRAARRL